LAKKDEIDNKSAHKFFTELKEPIELIQKIKNLLDKNTE